MKVSVELNELKDELNDETAIDSEEVVMLAMKAARLAFEEVLDLLDDSLFVELDLKARLISSGFRNILFEISFNDYWSSGKPLNTSENSEFSKE